MPRIGRKNLNTSFFHIIVQGLNKEYIFKNIRYIKEYRKLILNNISKYDVKIIAYCIMNNHAHILLYTERTEEMAGYMKSINTIYARYYNKSENRVGFVFRNRYQTEPIYNEEYLLNCIGYIHNNPVKAKMVNSPSEYKYSSYNDYVHNNGIAVKDTLKLVFGSEDNYMETYNAIHKEEYDFKDYIENIDYKIKYNDFRDKNMSEVVLNKEKLRYTIKKLVVKEKMPINKVSEILGISRFKVSRLLKQE